MANKIYSFADIDFRLHSNGTGIGGILNMSNGVHISCVFFKGSYGHREGLWEIWATNIEPDPIPLSIHEINAWLAELSELTIEQVCSMEEALTEAEELWSRDAMELMMEQESPDPED